MCLVAGLCYALGAQSGWTSTSQAVKDLKGQLVLARIAGYPVYKDGKTVLCLALDTDLEPKACLRITLNEPGFPDLARGQKIACRIIETSCPAKDGWQTYLRNNGLHGFAVIEPGSIRVVEEPLQAYRWIDSLRGTLKRDISWHMSPEGAALTMAMTIGDESGLTAAMTEAFQVCGLIHILVVSGLNLSLTAGTAAILARTLSGSHLISALAGIGFALFYGVVIGWQTPAWRAVMMLAAGLSIRAYGRPGQHILCLVYAAIIMMAINPFVIRQIGFQLSFGAVAALLFLPERLRVVFNLEKTRFIETLMVPLSAQLALAPIIVGISKSIAVYTVAANLLAVPAAGILTLTGFAGWLLSLSFPALSGYVWSLADILSSYIIGVAKLVQALPFSSVKVSGRAGMLLQAIFIGVVVAVLLNMLGIKKARAVIAVIFLILAAWFGISLVPGSPDDLTITFLDVGQGDATLIQTRSGKNILVDTGESGDRLMGKLRERGVRRIDALILSHPHADHIGGAQDVANTLYVSEVLDSGQVHESSTYEDLLTCFDRQNVSYRIVKAGQKFNVDDDLTLSVLGPPKHPVTGSESDENNNSLVCLFQYEDFRLLIPGDIGPQGEQALLAKPEAIEAQVLKVAHHGSETSSSEAFLRAVHAELSVVSVGEDNDFGHPAPATLVRLKEFCRAMAETDINGDITITVTEDGDYSVNTEKGELIDGQEAA